MPNAIIKSFAQKSGKTETEVDRLWKKAEEITKNSNVSVDDKYAYIVGILKNMLGIDEDFGIGVGGATGLNAPAPVIGPENSGVYAPKIGTGKIQKRKLEPHIEWLTGL